MHRPHVAILKIEHRRTDGHAQHHHRLQADQTPLEEAADGHAPPAVVVGVADDESRKGEEEIDGQIAVVEQLVEMACGVRLAKVEDDDEQRRNAAQAVQNFIVRFTVGIGSRRESGNIHRNRGFFGVQK